MKATKELLTNIMKLIDDFDNNGKEKTVEGYDQAMTSIYNLCEDHTDNLKTEKHEIIKEICHLLDIDPEDALTAIAYKAN